MKYSFSLELSLNRIWKTMFTLRLIESFWMQMQYEIHYQNT